MKETLKNIVMVVVFGIILFLVDYNRVTSCGYPEYNKCQDYSEYYGFD